MHQYQADRQLIRQHLTHTCHSTALQGRAVYQYQADRQQAGQQQQQTGRAVELQADLDL